jgi:ribosomal protein L35
MLVRAGGWKQHKLEAKSPKRRRRLRKSKQIDSADAARMQVLVPYL